ncbi:unnamed protein product [Cyclocybe aegerita]|uniref:RanBD1 domain-containing protein n=1 Tax=Cyclocybe aegerita TaxID=1973307 RepID=A0A8S0XKY8_CYCAE|nr:unnamed protein product [Cyclocybe aegerita]
MFPVGDFNFVVAGIATFAATVGYACTRKMSGSLSGPAAQIVREELAREAVSQEKVSNLQDAIETQTNADSEMTSIQAPSTLEDTPIIPIFPAPTRKGSLKRKIPHDGFDEPEKDVDKLGYPYNLFNIYPNKRSRTPTAESEATTPALTPATTLDSITSQESSAADVQIPMISRDPEPIIATPAPEPPRTPSPAPEPEQAAPPRLPSPSPVAAPAPAAAPELAPTRAHTPEPVAALPVTPAPAPPANPFAAFASRSPLPSTPKPKPKPFTSTSTGGFAAFAGSASSFASVKNPNTLTQSLSQSRTLGGKPGRSIWSSSPGDLKTHQNDDEAAEDLVKDEKNKKEESHALEEAKGLVSPPSTKYTHVTGEEDEDVELELKGVRLFTKRGSKPFAEGVAGHIKLLSDRKTSEQRLLFRREPLWKVSMNVRVQPTVRCTYVPEENVVRIILKETVDSPSGETKDGETKQELVIYALKPGRSCSKQDFKDFAETLSKSAHFKPTRTRTP